MTSSLWFCSKEEPTNFNVDFVNNNNFILSSIGLNYWETLKLMEQMEWTNAVSLKYQSNFVRSQMSLINCKVELKPNWINHCVSSAASADNDNANSNIIFKIKDTKLCVTVVTLSAEDNQKVSKLLTKRFERSVS